MELSHSLVDALTRPKFVLEHSRLRDHFKQPQLARFIPWDLSPLNPKNRVDSLGEAGSRWRIDGGTACGTCLFAVPLDLLPELPPLRIFIFLPDQTTYPPALRVSLNASHNVALRHGPAIAQLPVSRYVCVALDYHCSKDPGLLRRYLGLPFGSRMVFDRIAANPADMCLTLVPNYGLERNILTVQRLHDLWPDIEHAAWPPVVDVSSLRLELQIHDTVSLVRAQDFDDIVIFKSAFESLPHLYHELRFLLTAPPHPHVMPKPLAIVTKRTNFGGKHGVVGFILKHFPAGSIRDILPARQRAGQLPTPLKLSWCRQVAAALLHIREAAGTCFADLRPDNVLLDEDDSIVLCDFEQRGNWHEWCAPEILFRQYVENIRSLVSPGTRYGPLLDGFPCLASTPVEAKNAAWFTLSEAAQDKAAVYSLGLFVYVVFEGLSSVRRSIANEWPEDPQVEFPATRYTPDAVMRLVRRCTVDAPEWAEGSGSKRQQRVVRIGAVAYPESRLNLEPGTAEATDAVLDAALGWWTAELERANEFVMSSAWRNGEVGSGRVTLREALDALNSLAKVH